MPPPVTQARREHCRLEVRAYLADRPRLAFAATDIRRSLKYLESADWSEEEIEDACAFLLSLGQVEVLPEELGATRRYRITAAGQLAHERRQ